MKEQMDLCQYMLSSENYNLDEKKKVKEELEKHMEKFNDISDQ